METKVFIGLDEKEIISNVRDFLSGFREPVLAGFNIIPFDIPLLKSRFIKYDLDSINLFGTKYEYLDCRDILENLTSKGSLQNYLDFFGMEGKHNGLDGSQVQRLYEEENFDEIEKYQRQDVVIEHKLLHKILKYQKKKYNMKNVITIDIEVIINPKKVVVDDILPNEEEARKNYEDNLKLKYKQQKTIDKYIQEFNYSKIVSEHEEKIEKEKKKLIFDKFSNQIISVGVAWGEINEVDKKTDTGEF